jgi:hypothetical protein
MTVNNQVAAWTAGAGSRGMDCGSGPLLSGDRFSFALQVIDLFIEFGKF